MRLLLLANVCVSVCATVIGVDFGSDWLKIAVIRPGGVLETVLNRESKRKTHNLLTFRDGIRFFGSDAASLGMRFPQNTFRAVKTLLGKTYLDVAASDFRHSYPNVMVDRNGRIAFEVENEVYSVEEITANLLAHAKVQAEIYANITVTGAVITVPPYFSHFERQAILDAAELANLRIFALINDETAVAINFAMGKKFIEKEHHVFYDMGAGSTVATAIAFHSAESKVTKKNVLDMEVKAIGYHSTLGGQAVDVIIQNHLAKEFQTKNTGALGGKSIFDNTRAMARILMEANRVKTILSANHQVTSSIENLMEGIDFRLAVTRKELEKMCGSLLNQCVNPLDATLKHANLTMSQIKSLVLVGGGVRIPYVQTQLVAKVGQDKIARNIDGDEAAVLGAVLHGASVSAQFQLGTKFRVKDLNVLPIQVTYATEPNGKAERVLKTVLFTANTHLGSKKLMTFKRNSDFSFSAMYKTHPNGVVAIADVHVTGVGAAFAKFGSDVYDVRDEKVRVQMRLSDSGIFVVDDAHLTLSVIAKGKPENMKDSILGFLGGSKKTTEEMDQPPIREAGEDSSDSEFEDVVDAVEPKKKGVKKQAAVVPSGPKLVVETIKLKFDVEWKTRTPLSAQEKSTILKRIQKMDQQDHDRLERETLQNELESLVYKCREVSTDDEVSQYATENELAALEKKSSDVGDWLDSSSEKTAKLEFEKRFNELLAMHSRIIYRKRQDECRDDLLAELEAAVLDAEALQASINLTDTTLGQLYTSHEIEGLNSSVYNTTVWMTLRKQEQSLLLKTDDPRFSCEDVAVRVKFIGEMLRSLDLSERLKSRAMRVAREKAAADRKEKKKMNSTVLDSTPENSTMEEALNSTMEDVMRSMNFTMEDIMNSTGTGTDSDIADADSDSESFADDENEESEVESEVNDSGNVQDKDEL